MEEDQELLFLDSVNSVPIAGNVRGPFLLGLGKGHQQTNFTSPTNFRHRFVFDLQRLNRLLDVGVRTSDADSVAHFECLTCVDLYRGYTDLLKEIGDSSNLNLRVRHMHRPLPHTTNFPLLHP